MKKIRLFLFCLAVFVCAVTAERSAAQNMVKQSYDFSAIRHTIQSWVDSGHYNGASMIVVKNDSVIYQQYFGDYRPGTVVFIASAGKWLAAATIAAIVDEGKLGWDDKVKKWLPEFTGAKGEATLAQLLSHTAGYPDYQPKGQPVDIYQTLTESVARISGLPADTLPGTKFKYGGLAMQVAGRMAELATGQDWETLFQGKIAGPLGMASTHFTPVDSAGGHAPMLGGGARSTLSDYASFLKMLSHDGMFNGKRILSVNAVKAMQADQIKNAEIGAGEFVEKVRGNLHKSIYGLGEWREEINGDGNATLISSPSWAGAYPWIDKKNNLYGFFLTHVTGFKKGFSPFYSSPVFATMVRGTLGDGNQIALEKHPCLYATEKDKPAIIQKIKDEEWAGEAFSKLKNDIETYVDRHVSDPAWIVSRLAMYWKEGERYTQCYLKNQNWDYGEGNAPVPTVRLPGMRVWNDFVNVPLEERTPYNESGDMKATSRKDPSAPPVIVPYKNSGHLVRGNNVEILTLAEKSAFAYWITKEEKYAKFAGDIFNTWLAGTYYMKPPYDPSIMKDGYDVGGIFGYYDYEQIHDDLALHAAVIYDFLYGYLNKNTYPSLQKIKKPYTEIAAVVFKRFIDIGMVRGGKTGNWNVNGWNMMIRPILVLEPNEYYADKKGREYYLHYFTDESTAYHDALPDILKMYDPVTGLWPESPGYAFGTISSLLDFAVPLYLSGHDIVQKNPLLQKAALAVFPWMDARGNMVVFGDSRGGAADYNTFERLLAYYSLTAEKQNAALVAAALQKGISSGQYSRSSTGWTGICTNAPLRKTNNDIPYVRSAWSAEHRHLTMKNGNDEKGALMFTMYGGTKGKHLSPNGLALQLYGFGWVLAPDASAYESYWSRDYSYHQSPTGVNTILPGYAEGPVEINAMEPAPGKDSFATSAAISPYCSFADFSAGEKRRMVAMIRTSATTGYYVDVFRSNLSENDYIWHNLGNTLAVADSLNHPLNFAAVNTIDTIYNKNYSFFTAPWRVRYSGDFNARWSVNTVSPSVNMNMWMKGAKGRELTIVKAPPTTLNKELVPGGVNASPETTPTLLVRQNNNNAYQFPYVAVFDPFYGNQRSVGKITALPTAGSSTALLIESDVLNHRKETVIYNVNEQLARPRKGMVFKGRFAVISEDAGGLLYLYMGSGKLLSIGGYGISSENDVAASILIDNKKITYSSSGEVSIMLPVTKGNKSARLFYKKDGKFIAAATGNNAGTQMVCGVLPAGNNIEIKLL